MKLRVGKESRARFFDPAPPGSFERWPFSFRPPCEPGETIEFEFDDVVVATAVCERIDAARHHGGAGDARWWLVWRADSFRDVRPRASRGEPALFGGGQGA